MEEVPEWVYACWQCKLVALEQESYCTKGATIFYRMGGRLSLMPGRPIFSAPPFAYG